MTGSLFARYVFNALFGSMVATLSILTLVLHGARRLSTPFVHPNVISLITALCWALGVTSFAYMYFRVWPRLVPTREQLVKDLRRISYVVPLDSYVAATYTQDDVKRYYGSTSFRDYRIFEMGTGSNALHTELVPAARLPYQIGFFQQLVHVIAHMPDSGHTGNILEVGFGKGSNLIYLASLFPKAHFVGVDLLEEHVTYARRYASCSRLSNVSFFRGDAANLLGGSSSTSVQYYDLIFGIESFCHLDSDEALEGFLLYAQQHLRPNTGRIIVVDGFRSRSFAEAPQEAQQAMNLAESGFRIRRMASKDLWRTMGAAAGFDVVRDVDLTPQASRFWTLGWKVAQLLLLLLPPQLLGAYFSFSPVTRPSLG
jgi:predicted O-methyltransferase YrrM